MGSEPRPSNKNPYFVARKEAAKYSDRLNSRASAAELLGVSESTLSDYELGLTKYVPPDRVCAMAELYNAPELRERYCAEECPIGCGSCHGELRGLETLAIQLNRALRPVDMEALRDMVMDVAEDGVISPGEKDAMQNIMRSLARMDKVIRDVMLFCEKHRGGMTW